MTKARTTKRDRVEQAVAYGRSLDWICDNLDVEPAFVDKTLRGMDTAVGAADDEPETKPPVLMWEGRPISSYFGPADPSTIRELVDAVVPHERNRPGRDETVMRLSGEGMSDKAIAAAVGMTRQGVWSLRRRVKSQQEAAA